MPKNMRMSKVFVDTNIVVDIIDSERKGHFYGIKLIEILIKNGINIAISEDMFTTIYYVVKNKEKVLKFLDYITEKWKIYNYGDILVKKAIKISLQKGVDFEDVLQCLCAKENGCEVLITNDKKFYNCGIKIMTSREFVELYSG